VAIREANVDELAAELARGARLIDVREPGEYDSGHVPGAVLIPLGDVPDNIERFRGEGPAYLICRTGGRSMRACEYLAGFGIDAVNVAGGTLAWELSGREVATAAT
jgi:rhodanese-related sulfurtransferase